MLLVVFGVVLLVFIMRWYSFLLCCLFFDAVVMVSWGVMLLYWPRINAVTIKCCWFTLTRIKWVIFSAKLYLRQCLLKGERSAYNTSMVKHSPSRGVKVSDHRSDNSNRRTTNSNKKPSTSLRSEPQSRITAATTATEEPQTVSKNRSKFEVWTQKKNKKNKSYKPQQIWGLNPKEEEQ